LSVSAPASTTTNLSSPTTVEELAHRAAWKAGIIGGLNVAALVLAARLILMIAVLGAIALTWLALETESPTRLGAVGLYTITVVLPLVWLGGRR
jgi:hypothetical protein